MAVIPGSFFSTGADGLRYLVVDIIVVDSVVHAIFRLSVLGLCLVLSSQGDMLALVGVAAGLKTSLMLSICCVGLRDALACPVLDEQIFGR